MNYIAQVHRSKTGTVKEVTANADGVRLTFIRGLDGRLRLVSRSRAAMVYTDDGCYVPQDVYVRVVRQVAGVFATPWVKKPKQMGFQFDGNQEVKS